MKWEIDMDAEFERTFISGGTMNAECHCGREHISMHGMDNWDFSEGETTPEEMRAEWEEDAKTNDMLVLDYEYDGQCLIELGGKIFVAGCPCKGWKPYMEFMIDNRRKIAKFLVETSKEIKRIQSYEEVMDVLGDEYKVPRA